MRLARVYNCLTALSNQVPVRVADSFVKANSDRVQGF